jgi:hypothetical protein
MKTGRKQVIVTLVTALVVTLITVSAHATEHYVLTCVGNATNIPINYAYRWGNSEWQHGTVQPGTWSMHALKYDPSYGQPRAALMIRFDADLSAATYGRTYELERYVAPQPNDCEQHGREYDFVYVSEGAIDLQDSEAPQRPQPHLSRTYTYSY